MNKKVIYAVMVLLSVSFTSVKGQQAGSPAGNADSFELGKSGILSKTDRAAFFPDNRGSGMTSIFGEEDLVYVGLGIGFGPGATRYGFSYSFIAPVNWGVSMSYRHNSFAASGMPGDFGSSEIAPGDMLNTKSFTIMREFPVRTILRLGLEAGISDAIYKKSIFTKRAPNAKPGLGAYTQYSSNLYDVTLGREVSVGLSLRTKVEFPLTKFFGVEFAAYGNINKFKSFYGFEMYLVFGRVRL